jgi:hypothetical protein
MLTRQCRVEDGSRMAAYRTIDACVLASIRRGVCEVALPGLQDLQ